MKLKSIKKALKSKGIGVLLYGGTGEGKTWSIGGLPPEHTKIITNEEHGLATLRQRGWEKADWEKPLTSKAWRECLQACADDKDIHYVVLDTVSTYYSLLWNEFLKEKSLEPDQVDWSIYGYCLHHFRGMIWDVFSLVQQGKSCILLCHIDWRKEKNANTEVQWSEPDLPGKLRQDICKNLDLVLRVERITMAGQAKYLMSVPLLGKHYGKDVYGIVTEPMPNDVMTLIQSVRALNEGGGTSKGALNQKPVNESKAKPEIFPPNKPSTTKKPSPSPTKFVAEPPLEEKPPPQDKKEPETAKQETLETTTDTDLEYKPDILSGVAEACGMNTAHLSLWVSNRYDVKGVNDLSQEQLKDAIDELHSWREADGRSETKEEAKSAF